MITIFAWLCLIFTLWTLRAQRPVVFEAAMIVLITIVAVMTIVYAR